MRPVESAIIGRCAGLLHILSIALITAGIVIAADVALTLAWKEPLSTVYGSIKQGQAEDSLAELEQSFPAPADLRAVAARRRRREQVAEAAGRPVRRAGRHRPGDRADQDPEHRRRLRRRPGHRHREPAEGPGPLPRDRLPRPGQDDRDRRPPHHLPGPVPRHQRDRRRRRDRARDALRDLHLHGREARDRRPEPDRDRRQRRLRAAGADRLPPALQRRAALGGVREAHRR